MGMLMETWTSKANGTQRKGRAGRVQSGHCFRLFSQHKWEALPDHQVGLSTS
jgi:HrpA-like RNA helicase